MFARHHGPLAHWNAELNRLRREMRHWLRRGADAFTPEGVPAINVWEDDHNYFVEAELPGLALEDLEIHVDGGRVLTLKGKREPPPVENGAWHRRERGFGEFVRSWELPRQVDADKVTAELKLGVLTITLPKAEEAKPRRVVVKAE